MASSSYIMDSEFEKTLIVLKRCDDETLTKMASEGLIPFPTRLSCLQTLVIKNPEAFQRSNSETLVDIAWVLIVENGAGIIAELHRLIPNCLYISQRYTGTLLHRCARDPAKVEELKTILSIDPTIASKKQNPEGSLALHSCFSHEMAGPLVDAWPLSLNYKTSNGYTPLHSAVDNNQPEVFKALLDLGADPTVKNNYGRTPYTMINSVEFYDVVDKLMKD